MKNLKIEQSVLQEIRESEDRLQKERAEKKAVFKEIRKLVSAYKVRKLREYMSDMDYWNLKIVDTHGAVKPQDEPYWFRQAYVYQYCGYTGDDYCGTIWIPLPNGKYLQFPFCC